MLVDIGNVVFKFCLEVVRAMQLKRLQERRGLHAILIR
jgi:polyphosphate kinase 2 (PPK2 family)